MDHSSPPHKQFTVTDGESWFFPELHAALQSWSRAAGAAMAAYAASHADQEWADVVGAQTALAFDLSDWTAVDRVVRQDPRLVAQIDHNVGSVLWTQPVEKRDLGYQFINAMLFGLQYRSDPNYELSPQAFADLYAPLDSFLGEDSIPYQVTAIIVGLDCESAPIDLGDNTAIELIEIEHASAHTLTTSLIDVAYSQISRGIVGELDVPKHYRHAFTKKFSLPKGLHDGTRAAAVYEDIEKARRTCLLAIAACTATFVIPWRSYVSERGWRRNRSSVTLSGPRMLWRFEGPGAHIRLSNEPALRRALTHLRHRDFAKRNAAVSIALTRLADLGTRLTNEDRLVDVMIAAEAFFIPRGETAAELRYRLAANAAVLAKHIWPDMRQRDVFDFMHAAYNLRSRILHGDLLAETAYKFAGVHLDLTGFVMRASEIVRGAISWALSRFEPGQQIEIDWPALMFPAEPPLG